MTKRDITIAGIAVLLTGMPVRAGTDLTALPGLVVTASSEWRTFSANGPKENVLDDDISTLWNAGSFSGWLQVDFGQNFQFERIELLGGYGETVRGVSHYRLLVSTDETSWNDVASGDFHDEALLTRGSPKWGSVHGFLEPTQPVGRYLRYEKAVEQGDWAFLVELEAIGHVPGAVIPGIPEPKSWAEILAGLGLLAFIARRRIPHRGEEVWPVASRDDELSQPFAWLARAGAAS